ncbi:hypothetical protein NLK61_13890 [Pseudomonas fuscovaginae UPB0736]|uniref:Uncharacterized protein n=1 Tax=Pseudomonas asplenii TaxID=53407 RepID=A0A1H6LNI1_9PSED|nr:hypothetical protein [Pseudomonas fuscovaginae]UUQ67673.1 hypothetical protein NLK61_13890 [Pseudomonas fuscovaginae UPB0736]SEH86973.1 hypothetical protein SAMN05216581_0229 [Pseudomonas fuscovaginae]
MNLKVRPLDKILENSVTSKAIETLTPEYAAPLLSQLIGQELASDFIVCDLTYFKKYNDFLYSECPEAKGVWVVFATSGQGDFWLLNYSKNLIGYYEHNDENLSLENIKNMRFDLKTWIILADLIHQLELKSESDDLNAQDRKELITELKSLDISLESLPFEYF